MSDESTASGPGARDFPFYAGSPVGLSAPQWLFVLAMTALGFLALIAPVPFFKGGYGQLVPAILFLVIPLAGLALVAGRHWRALFRRVGGLDVVWMILVAVLNILVSLAVGSLVLKLFGATANPAISGLAAQSSGDKVLFFLKTLPQLLGEEVLTMLPFLALLTLLSRGGRGARRPAIVGAWIGSAVIFAMAHLPTYGWDWIQCLLVIGSARLTLTLAYLKTKNLWVSAGAHILNDWFIFATSLLGAAAAAS